MSACERLAKECNASFVYQGVNGMRIWYYEGKHPLAIIQRSAKAFNMKRGDYLVFASPERREAWAKEQMDKAEAMAHRRSEAKRANLEHRTALIRPRVGDCGKIGDRHFSPMGTKDRIGCSWYA